MSNPLELLAIAQRVANEASRVLTDALSGEGPVITTKSTPTDLVTDIDVAVERLITARLLDARPDDSIEGEEGANVAGTSEVIWSVDPIDGTVNFVHRLPGFNVSIGALIDGEPVAGVVASPLQNEVFTAAAGHGAFCNGHQVRCSSPPSLGRSVIATGFAYDPARRTRQAQVVADVISDFGDIRRFGAAATDFCHVAAGRVDGYWEVGLNPWDLAAGSLIAREAGAKVAALDGSSPSGLSVLAAPLEIWDELATLLNSVGATKV